MILNWNKIREYFGSWALRLYSMLMDLWRDFNMLQEFEIWHREKNKKIKFIASKIETTCLFSNVLLFVQSCVGSNKTNLDRKKKKKTKIRLNPKKRASLRHWLLPMWLAYQPIQTMYFMDVEKYTFIEFIRSFLFVHTQSLAISNEANKFSKRFCLFWNESH